MGAAGGHKVWTMKAQQGMPREDEARRMFQKIARQECNKMIHRRISDSNQWRHPGVLSRQPPPAGKRTVSGPLPPTGPTRLGGENDIMSALSPAQAAAMAAERRLLDDIWCGSSSCQKPKVTTESLGGPRDIHPLAAKFEFWSCKFWTMDNGVDLDKCSACQQWRYSTGDPGLLFPLQWRFENYN
ncbi:hypothetical protein CDL15_Pgr012064 [Punica granatum]|nr:hypothetical protein CDL15_Pgr012064 [Punica granatum]